MHAATVAIDLAKDVFELAFADSQGHIIERKRLSRSAFSRCLANQPPLRAVKHNMDIQYSEKPPQINAGFPYSP